MEHPFVFLAEKMKIINLAYEDGDCTHRLADIGIVKISLVISLIKVRIKLYCTEALLQSYRNQYF